jgi:glycosyltransferase involved in cell wall biosynthesis
VRNAMGLKVLVIGTYPLEPGVVSGGVESATSTLVPALAERDDIDSVTVLRFHHGEASTEYRRESPKVEVHYIRGQYRFRMLTGAYLDLRKARKLIAAVGPDVIHGQEIGLNSDIATRCSPDCVVTVHGITYVETRLYHRKSIRTALRARMIHRVARRVLHRAKVVISISEYDAAELSGLTRGIRVSIDNATDPRYSALAPSPSTAPRLLFAGALIPLKNPLGLVNAFAQARRAVPDARLVLVGPHPDAAYAAAVRERVQALGLTDCVDLEGFADNDRMLHEIAIARAVVLFSRQENAPTIIAQAMAARKPVVASRVGGIPNMVQDGVSGLLVDSEDEVALAEQLTRVLDDQDLCLRMGSRGHAIALDRFTPETVAAATVDAYHTALMRSHA